ncbi:hypothetical protein L596_005261 [Steinernema carpocapsae]|uniref:Uncharacterized protein n=1 Tax=Steinernema carpocapsae TaxID=34508 RepID=A0A4U8UYF8_STECR|nr:hypothetical protein L596_005261 [Steinernema carpocapsae]
MVDEWSLTRMCVPVGEMRYSLELGTIPHVLPGVDHENFYRRQHRRDPPIARFDRSTSVGRSIIIDCFCKMSPCRGRCDRFQNTCLLKFECTVVAGDSDYRTTGHCDKTSKSHKNFL